MSIFGNYQNRFEDTQHEEYGSYVSETELRR